YLERDRTGMPVSVSGVHRLAKGGALGLALLGMAATVRAQDEDAGAQLALELRQLRSEVDFLRDQLETGGGVADVRFESLQARIDQLLEYATAVSEEADRASRLAESALRSTSELTFKIASLEETIAAMQDQIDTLSAAAPAAAPEEVPDTAPAPVAASDPAAVDAEADQAVVAPALPKDRPEDGIPAHEALAGDPDYVEPEGGAEAEAARETESETETETETVSEASGAEVAQADTPAAADDRAGPDTAAQPDEGSETETETEDFSDTFGAAAPAVPALRPEAPAHVQLDDDRAALAASAEIDEATREAFEAASDLFEAGDFSGASAALRQVIDTGALGSEEAEALYMLGTAYLRAGDYPLAIQVLAQGLRSFPTSDFAARSILNLADALNANGQRAEGCRLLSFVPVEYPLDTDAISDASARSEQLDC
ncbi:MAG: tetratricopeptide repeat protein, partial [Alphaproteobacteria bacterium]